MENRYFIIDFDSTFIQTEGLEELATVALEDHPKKERVLKEIAALTALGMEGRLPFDEALRKRLQLLKAEKSHIEKTTKLLKKKISPSIKRNREFFRKFSERIFIVSGGFKELIVPIVVPYGISEDHIFANTFLYNKQGEVVGVDPKNLLAGRSGKAKIVNSLKLQGDILVIGDGYTDYEITEYIPTAAFYAFTENTERQSVVEKADRVVKTFDEFLYVHDLPRSLSYPKNRLKVVLFENIHHQAVSMFEKEGYPVEYYEKSPDFETLQRVIRDASILGIRSRTVINRELLELAERLKAIGTYSIGTEQIDLTAATEHGIAVFNAPFSNTRSVVELIIGEMIMLARGVFEKSTKLHQGVWDKSAAGSIELRGKTLGIVGYGNIGSQLSVLAEAMGMRVMYFDIVEKLALGNARSVSLKMLLKESDVVTIHVDGNKRNKHLIGEQEFRVMKDGVLFLNASRGFVVDHKALVKYLRNGKIRGAAIDVFPEEPKGNGEVLQSELRHLPNVILTPHIGGSTEEAQERIGTFVTHQLIEYLNTGTTNLSVNLPNLKLEQQQAHRLLHLHRNTPGVLAQINTVFASHQANILGQHLKTNDTIGYAITDIDKRYDAGLLTALKAIPETIRFRILY